MASVRCFVAPHFFFNDPAPAEIYTLSLHDALPIWLKSEEYKPCLRATPRPCQRSKTRTTTNAKIPTVVPTRSEEHTSELQSPDQLVCRPLLEKKKRQCSRLWRNAIPSRSARCHSGR